MREKEFNINETEKEQLEYLLSLDFSENKSVEILGDIFLKSKRIEFLRGFVCNRFEFNDDFIQNAKIDPLLNIVSKLPNNKAKLLWDLLYWKLLHTEDYKEKESILKKLEECNDSYLKIYIIKSFSRKDVISKDELKKALNFDGPLELFSFSVKNTRNLVNDIIAFIDNSDYMPIQFYAKLKDIFSELNTTDKDSNHYEELNTFLSKLLLLVGFSNCDALLKLFTDYYKVEEQLLVSFDEKGRRNHRDHILHSLNVFLLGVVFLLIDWQIKGKYNIFDLASWVLTSFFHDVGYGIEKLEQISLAIKEHYNRFGDINSAKFNLKQSFSILRDETIKKMEEILVQHQNEENHPAHIMMPILESLDAKKHGIMSAIMVRKEIDEMMSKDSQFRQMFSPLWEKIFLRSALAMTLHTCIEEFSCGFIVDEWHPPRADDISDLLFPTFLLILIDSIEYINRPRFGGIYTGKQILDYDINLKIHFNISYDFDCFSIVNIVLEYANQEILSDRVSDFINRLNKFYSENWGITIVIRVPIEKEDNGGDMKEITLFLLRNEWKKFKDYIVKKEINLKEIRISEINDVYDSFSKEIFKKNSKNVSDEELKEISDREISYQIIRGYYKTQRQFW